MKNAKSTVRGKRPRNALAVNNASSSRVISTRGTKVTSLAGRDFVVSNRELMTDVVGTAAFSCTSYLINPGRSAFPWLSQFATCFDMYQIDSLRVVYVPACATTTSGMLHLAFDYDVTDALPNTEMGFSVTQGNTATPYYSGVSIRFDPNGNTFRRFFVTPAGSSEDRTADAGQILIGTNGANGVVVGSLWLEYTIRLIRPQINQLILYAQVGDDAGATSTKQGPATAPSLWTPVTNFNSSSYSGTAYLSNRVTVKGLAAQAYDALTGIFSLPKGTSYLMELVARGIATSAQTITQSNLANFMAVASKYGTVTARPEEQTITAWPEGAEGRWYLPYTLTSTSTTEPMSLQPYLSSAFAAVLASLATEISFTKLEL